MFECVFVRMLVVVLVLIATSVQSIVQIALQRQWFALPCIRHKPSLHQVHQIVRILGFRHVSVNCGASLARLRLL